MILHFNRVAFGVGPSPFLLNTALHYHLSHYEEADSELIQQLHDAFYIDDLTRGKRTVNPQLTFKKGQKLA